MESVLNDVLNLCKQLVKSAFVAQRSLSRTEIVMDMSRGKCGLLRIDFVASL